MGATRRQGAPLMIEVRANEFALPDHNPHVPISSAALVADGLECLAAGASVYHWHAQGDSVDAAAQLRVNQEVAAGLQASGLVLHPTLGFTTSQGDVDARLATVRALRSDPSTDVDIVPVDIGAAVLDLWDPTGSRFLTRDRVLVNPTDYLERLLSRLGDVGVKVLAVVWSPGAVRTALRLRDAGMLAAPTFWQLGFTGERTPGGPPATRASLRAFLEQLPLDEPWTVHVRDGQGLQMAEWAVEQGGHVSIGLGDDPYLDRGTPKNADLVTEVVAMAARAGRPVADPAAARRLLGLASSAAGGEGHPGSPRRTATAHHEEGRTWTT